MEETIEDQKFIATMESIVFSAEKMGMKPYAQLYGYLISGNDMYITRTGNARKLIKTLNWQKVWDCEKKMEKSL